MPVPSTINDLSTTAGSNSPSGGENPFPDLDNHLRALASFIAELRDGKLAASAVSSFILTLLDDANAAAARTTLGAVGLTGNETVAGIKTFSSSPIAPTPAPGDNSTKVATTAFVAANTAPAASTTTAGIVELATSAEVQAGASATLAVTPSTLAAAMLGGDGQAWTDVRTTPGRLFGTTYTNDTGRPIVVSVWGQTTSSTTSMTTTVAGITIGQQGTSFAGITLTSVFVVPPGATYSVSVANNSLQGWVELR